MLFPNAYTDPFSTDCLLNIPDLDITPSLLWLPFTDPEGFKSEILRLAEVKPERLPSLRTDCFQLDFEEISLPDLDASITAGATSEDEQAEPEQEGQFDLDEFGDLWNLPDVQQRSTQNKLLSWDTFREEKQVHSQSAYLSEAGAEIFNALWHDTALSTDVLPPQIAKPDVFLSSLFDLGMGRESAFFKFDAQHVPSAREERKLVLPNLGVEVVVKIVDDFKDCGSKWLKLQEFTEYSVKCGSPDGARTAALASCVNSVLHGLGVQLEGVRHGTESILQLQQLFNRPKIILDVLCAILELFHGMKRASFDLPKLLAKVQDRAEQHPFAAEILEKISSRVISPLLSDIEVAVGLELNLRRLVTVDQGCLHGDMSRLIQDSRQSLKLLEAHEQNHPLLRNGVLRKRLRQHLQLEYSWEALDKLHARALKYEQSLKEAIWGARSALEDDTIHLEGEEDLSVVVSPFSAETVLALPLDSYPQLNIPLGHGPLADSDIFFDAVRNSFHEPEVQSFVLKPPLTDALSLSITPLLTAQHRLLSYSVLQVLFQKHQLRQHMNTLHRYQLFGDGLFSARLSDALFNTERASGEGKRRTGGITGLRLPSRDTWPPASSELRLALMGILAESMSSRFQSSNAPLSDSMSFAIRDLSDDELEKCRDVDSIHALDFLRLQYKPTSSILEAIVTPKSLQRHDQIFKHLLRLLRAQSAARMLLRQVSNRHVSIAGKSDHGFRVDIHHFVSALMDFSTNIAVGVPWRGFEATLAKIEHSLEQKDFEGTIALVNGLDRLRILHEDTLDEMKGALFLKRSHTVVLALLEEILGIVLRFAALARKSGDDGIIRRMHVEFQRKVMDFVQHLQADAASGGTGSVCEQLLLRLDMFGYWIRVEKARPPA